MFRLVIVNLFRNPLRTLLTMASVTVAPDAQTQEADDGIRTPE